MSIVAGRHERVGIIIAFAFARGPAQVRRRTYKCIHTGTRIYIHIYTLRVYLYHVIKRVTRNESSIVVAGRRRKGGIQGGQVARCERSTRIGVSDVNPANAADDRVALRWNCGENRGGKGRASRASISARASRRIQWRLIQGTKFHLAVGPRRREGTPISTGN